MGNPINTYFAAYVQDQALDKVVEILRLMTDTGADLVGWVGGTDRIQRSTSFEALALDSLSVPFVLVGSLQESEDFTPSGKTDIDFSVGILIGFEDSETFETAGEATYLSVLQAIKAQLTKTNYGALKVSPSDPALSRGIARFEIVSYESAKVGDGVEAALTLRVVYRLALQTGNRERFGGS